MADEPASLTAGSKVTHVRSVDPISLATMRTFPRPTRAQRASFIEYLCFEHGWYKALSLWEGREFVVFLGPKARGGHGWISLDSYRSRCGFLNYLDARDYEPSLQSVLPAELWPGCAFTLLPQCSNDDAAPEVLADLWGRTAERDFAELVTLNGGSETDEGLDPSFVDPSLRGRVIAIQDALDDGRDDDAKRIYAELRQPEVSKIERALDALERVLGP